MKKTIPGIFLVAVFLFSFAAHSAQSNVDVGTLPSYWKKTKVTLMEGTVAAIDLAKRVITLKGADGTQVTTKVDEKVKNLDQVKIGDWVRIKYYESRAWKVKKVENPEELTKKTTVTTTQRPMPGEKSKFKESTQTQLIATVEAIDSQNHSIIVKGPEGNSLTLKVTNPNNLKRIKMGDNVAIDYQESFAISVEPAAKK
jgi:ATP-dependent 26S proteasome regulatory subunit